MANTFHMTYEPLDRDKKIVVVCPSLLTPRLVGPWTWAAGRGESGALRLHLPQTLSKHLRKLTHLFGVLRGEVVRLADVVGEIVELVMSVIVEIYHLPIALTDGTRRSDARTTVVPYVGTVPYQGACPLPLAAAGIYIINKGKA